MEIEVNAIYYANNCYKYSSVVIFTGEYDNPEIFFLDTFIETNHNILTTGKITKEIVHFQECVINFLKAVWVFL